MDGSRREFLRAAGLTLIGTAGGSALVALSQETGVGGGVHDAAVATKRWGMVIDLPRLYETGAAQRCVEACHRAHNVPSFPDPKDEIKWIWTEEFENAFGEEESEHLSDLHRHKRVLVLCNHCENPPCVRVCPTQATWKRESDGIVMMDWHRCIGCRYCVVACPYGSRSFNWRDPRPAIAAITPDFPTRMRGVVEKCTFCEERLARGQLPACVEACEQGEILFGDLEDPSSDVRRLLAERFSIRRKPTLGTRPQVYYIV